jgi:hypothetical protein
MRTRHIVFCGPSGSTVCFALYFINGTNLEEKKLLSLKCVLISLHLLPETSFILKGTERDIKNVNWLSYKVPLFLLDFNET